MIVFSIIQKSQLEGSLRLDAEYYKPENLEKSQKLDLINSIKLGEIAYITDGEHGSPIFDEESGIKYYSAQHIKEGIIDSLGAKTISKIIDEKNKRSRLSVGDVLLSTVGTIGLASIVREKDLPANIDRHVAKITLKQNTLSPEYLMTFLNSSFGKFQTLRESTGNVQLNLFIEKIINLKVPKVNNDFISGLVITGLNEAENSEKYYQQAGDLLLEEVGLENYKAEESLNWVVNFSEVKEANRIDADYFQPKYESIVSLINRYGAKNLLEVVENVPARFNPSAKAEETFKYVELANINSSLGIIDGYSEVLGSEAPSRAKRILKEKDIIISSIGGSLDKVALVDEEHKDSLASTGFFQFRSRNLLPEVLLVLAKSPVLQLQLEKYVAGTILAAISNESLKNMVVPDLPLETQEKIADLVRRSHEARKKSKELLEEAKRKVEEMIEKGGELK